MVEYLYKYASYYSYAKVCEMFKAEVGKLKTERPSVSTYTKVLYNCCSTLYYKHRDIKILDNDTLDNIAKKRNDNEFNKLVRMYIIEIRSIMSAEIKRLRRPTSKTIFKVFDMAVDRMGKELLLITD